MSLCPATCTLLEPDNQPWQHSAISSFDSATATISIHTQDNELFDTTLSLQVFCESPSSLQDANIVSTFFNIQFEDPCQFDTVTFENSNPINSNYTYYIYEDTAETIQLEYGFTQTMPQCKATCRLERLYDLEAEHSAVTLFDNTTARVEISTSDLALVDTTLNLRVQCDSPASKQEESIIAGMISIAFEDPCQFDKTAFESFTAVESYYIQANEAIEAVIEHGFTHELKHCPTSCGLQEIKEGETHPAVTSFDKSTGAITLRSTD